MLRGGDGWIPSREITEPSRPNPRENFIVPNEVYRCFHRTRLWIRRIVIVQRRLHIITIIICLLWPRATKTLPRVIEPAQLTCVYYNNNNNNNGVWLLWWLVSIIYVKICRSVWRKKDSPSHEMWRSINFFKRLAIRQYHTEPHYYYDVPRLRYTPS